MDAGKMKSPRTFHKQRRKTATLQKQMDSMLNQVKRGTKGERKVKEHSKRVHGERGDNFVQTNGPTEASDEVKMYCESLPFLFSFRKLILILSILLSLSSSQRICPIPPFDHPHNS